VDCGIGHVSLTGRFLSSVFGQNSSSYYAPLGAAK
jgi:hypothetical protein